MSVEWDNTKSFSSLLGVRSDHKRDFHEIWNSEDKHHHYSEGNWTQLHFTPIFTDLLPHLIGRIQWLCPEVSELWLHHLLQVIWSGAR